MVCTAQKCTTHMYEAEITFTQTKSYCGGAAPADFLIRELRTPRPIKDRKLYLFNANEVCVDSFINPGDSTFVKDLAEGQWSVRLVDQLQINDRTTKREKCLIDWNQRKLASWSITGDTTMTVNLHFSCNPCYPPPP